MTDLLIFGAGVVIGIIIEWKYGAKGSQLNAYIHAKLDDIKAAVSAK